jgi:hypothetical protein
VSLQALEREVQRPASLVGADLCPEWVGWIDREVRKRDDEALLLIVRPAAFGSDLAANAALVVHVEHFVDLERMTGFGPEPLLPESADELAAGHSGNGQVRSKLVHQAGDGGRGIDHGGRILDEVKAL